MNKKSDISGYAVSLIILIIVLVVLFSYTPALARLLKAGTNLGKIDTGKIDNEKSATSSGEKQINQKPSPAKIVQAIYYNNKVTISWLKSTSPNIDSYAVVRHVGNEPPLDICVQSAEDIDKYTCIDDKGDLKIGTKYTYVLTTYADNGEYSESTVELIPNR